MARDPWQVALLAYDGLCTFEFGVMVELFGLPRPELDPWYRLRVGSLEPGPVRAAGGIQVEAPHSSRILDHAGTILIPGWRAPLEEVPEALCRKLRRAHEEGARLVSVCSGAFVLAAAGLLRGLRVTTHWRYAEQLRLAYPDLEVDPDVLYTDHGQILTSAGSAAGMDLGLHLIRRDCGVKVANAVARRLVVPPHREGGQQQFIEAPIPQSTHGGLGPVLDEMRADLVRGWTVETMAQRAHMSPRTLARRFKAETGTTPHRWLMSERVRRAQEVLESTELGLEAVADAVGFSDAQLLRLHFRREVGATPTAYRRAFRRRRG